MRISWRKRASSFVVTFVALAALAFGSSAAAGQPETVVFICEHGNVKSLMAASYFNELAQARRIPIRAISRSSAPDSTTVPHIIAAQLAKEGFDVAAYRSTKISAADVQEAVRVVLIGTSLPESAMQAAESSERWNEIPAASVDYRAASLALRKRVELLLDQLMRAPGE